MNARWLHLGLAGLVLSWLPALATAQDKKEPAKPETPMKEPPKQKLLPGPTVSGVITEMGKDGQSFKLQVTQRAYTVTGLDRYGRPQYGWKENKQDIEVIMAEDVKIRVPPKPQFDEKTNKPRPFRPDPKDPDRNLGGAKGEPGDLSQYSNVSVTFGQTRERPPRLLATIIILLPDVGNNR